MTLLLYKLFKVLSKSLPSSAIHFNGYTLAAPGFSAILLRQIFLCKLLASFFKTGTDILYFLAKDSAVTLTGPDFKSFNKFF